MNDFRMISRGLLFSTALCCAAGAYAAAEIVGEVTMVIGVGNVTAGDGASRSLSRGMTVSVGDRIETEAGGHVHVRFVDGALVSVRPLSRLQIEDYRHDQKSDASAIKFRLDQGVMRSVTGQWGEMARERYRLNTPLAAIGIKGTDFVVKTDGEQTLATVLSGAIVMAPLQGDCRGTVGPCQGEQAKLLSAEMQGQMLELSRQRGAPRLVPAADLLAQSGRGNVEMVRRPEKMQAADSPSSDKQAPNDARVAVAVVNDAPAVVANAHLPPAVPVVSQLAWVRWDWTQPYAADTFSQALDTATQSGKQGVVGNLAYSLFRPSASGFRPVDSTAEFRLASAAASLARIDGRTEAAQVSGGALSVDFAHSTFATVMGVTSNSLGNVALAANGTIQSNGVFRSNTGSMFVAGAFNESGAEAGYFFERNFWQGQLSGITLWGR